MSNEEDDSDVDNAKLITPPPPTPHAIGKSRNPGGRPKGTAGMAAYIRKKTNGFKDLVKIAIDIAKNETAKNSERMDAIRWLADRGLGKTPQIIEISTSSDSTSISIVDMTIEELRVLDRMAERLEAPQKVLPATASVVEGTFTEVPDDDHE